MQTTYAYDALNRLTEKSYSDGSLGTYFFYDQPGVANGIGRLYEAWAENAYTLNSGYDALGRVTQSQVVLYYQTYGFNYTYNLAGSLTSETYPSGRTVNTTYDTSNRPYTVSGTKNGQTTNYVTTAGYWPHGGQYWELYGNTICPMWVYNSRLQAQDVYSTVNNSAYAWLFLEELGWGGSNNNGNLQSAIVHEGGPGPLSRLATFNQSFLYESGNRLLAAYDSNWGRTFTYDQYGNMTVTTNSGVPLNGLTPLWQSGSPYNAANNRLLSGSYDAAGNQVGMGSLMSSFDAENRLARTYDTTAQLGVTYQYDAEGQRELKTVDGQAPTVYVRDAFGRVAAEYGSENTASCTTCYLSYDHLGSMRVVTDQNANVVSRQEYIPFGEEIPGGWVGRTGSGWGAADSLHQRFTGQERDGETGLDYFNARYYGSILGRFTSPDPDPGSMDVTNPQSFNGYAYVWNNPLANTDPTGADICINGSYADVCVSATPDPVPIETSSWLGGLGSGIPTFSVTHSEAWAPTPRQQQPGKTASQKLACAAQFGQNHSVAALFGGGKLANFVAGNTASSLVNLGLAVSGNGPAPQYPGALALSGPALGVPVNDALRLAGKQAIPELTSASGFIRTNALQAVFKAATGPAALTSIAQGGEVALQGGITAAEYASGIAIAKFGYDIGSLFYGYFFACGN